MIDQTQLAESLGRLDAGTRALLDLSLRRAIPDEQVAKVLGVDAASIPPRRARGIAQLADMMEIPGPSELAALLIAIPDLPEEAWGVPAPVPFAGGVSRARRAKAFRRVAIAASPLVALGAVMAAVVVASDHSSGGSGSGGTQHGGRGAGAAAGVAATAVAPDARHGLPPGVRLTLAHPQAARLARHAARHHRSHHAGGGAEHAVLARHPSSKAAPHSVPVAYEPSPVVHSEPRHVSHHPSAPKPHVPTSTPAPIKTPSKPVSSPAPPTPVSPPIQVSAPEINSGDDTPSPVKPPKTPPPSVDLDDSHEGDDDGGCGDDDGPSHQGSSHGGQHGRSAAQANQGNGRSFTPPGLFRKRHSH